LIKEAISFAFCLPTSPFFGSLMVLVNVLELLFALLGISVVAKICQLPDNNNNPKRRQSKKTSFVALSYLIKFMPYRWQWKKEA